MRLIQFTASNGWRGHEQKIIYLYEAFEDYGYVEDQWILCPINSKVYEIALEKKMKVIPFEYKGEYNVRMAKSIKNIADSHRASIIFIHSSKAHTLAVLANFLFGMKTPMVLCRTLIKRIDTNFFRKWKYNYSGIKKIICVSKPVVETLKYAVDDHSKLCVVGSVTDVDKFTKTKGNGLLHEEFNIPKNTLLIGNIAEFTGFKDHKTWIRTAEILLKTHQLNAKFILVGKGSLKEKIEQMVIEKGLEDHIIFTGFRTNIPQILPEFDLLLFTSNNEPTGGVLLEAYACKVPILAANAGGIPEVVINGKTGLLAEVENPHDFAKKTIQLISNAEMQKKFTENGYKFLIQNFTKKVIAEQLYQILNSVQLNQAT